MLDTEAVEEDEDGESLVSDDDDVDNAPNEMDLNDPFINDGEIEVEQVKKISVEEKRKALEEQIERLQKRLKKIDDSDVVLYE